MPGFLLPTAPGSERGAVKAWSEPVTIPTCLPMPADRNPMFLEKRVYQGSSGRVYPLPFVDRIREETIDRAWEAVHLENDYLRLMILPELGGRIHVGLDKTNGYDFFYRQNSIRPALVGLAGPWISGGVEFNWPQHHRPSTFMRTDWDIERHDDGSVTVWCGEHEPMNRMKGMHGICLHPGRSIVELKVRLYNRTEFVQTFLWWANVAVRVHEKYQSFFPPDVTCVADHAKRAMSRFPLCDGTYYGVDYGRRGREGVPEDQRSRKFQPPAGMYPPNDLSWYANIPVPTSYMAMGSKEDFFGGYDHALEAGLIHIADHRIAPGKKQWTWGNHEFGYAWDRNLSDDEGPYIELMAGVFTDNQPDFSFLMPGELRAWSQYWYPIQKIGPAQKANVEGAISLRRSGGKVRVGVAVTTPRPGARVELRSGAQATQWRADLSPDAPLVREADAPVDIADSQFEITVRTAEGMILLHYRPATPQPAELPPPAKEAAPPEAIPSIEDLYLAGLHLEQYRHATRMPEDYWNEALKRDPGDSRCNTAMGWWRLRRGDFEQAVRHFETAIHTLTRYNPNPRDGEAFYGLGVALRHLGRDSDAMEAFGKALWNQAWRSAACFAMAQLAARAAEWQAALEHLTQSLDANPHHLQARNLRALVLRKLGRDQEADAASRQMRTIDPLDAFSRLPAQGMASHDARTALDLAQELAAAGFYEEASRALRFQQRDGISTEHDAGARPLLRLLAADLARKREGAGGEQPRSGAEDASADYCFPARLEDLALLKAAMAANPQDSRPPCYLGNWMYDRRRRDEAIALWEKAVQLDRQDPTPWRNLGIAYFNTYRDAAAAKGAYERAFKAGPSDARLLYERDQLWKRTGTLPADRLEELDRHLDLVRQRDDLTVEYCALLNLTGNHEEALAVLKQRRFQPWEGGEGLVLGQWVRTHLALGKKAMAAGDADKATAYFQAGFHAPENLGEARHLLANQSDLHFAAGQALARSGDHQGARKHYHAAARARGDFQQMAVKAFSEMTYYSALALRALGGKENEREADTLLRELLAYAQDLEQRPATIDYFATSLPTMLLFEDDLQKRQQRHARLLAAQARLGLGDRAQARVLLTSILAEDPSEALASELLEFIGADPGLTASRH